MISDPFFFLSLSVVVDPLGPAKGRTTKESHYYYAAWRFSAGAQVFVNLFSLDGAVGFRKPRIVTG
jgi:hypothetical protein